MTGTTKAPTPDDWRRLAKEVENRRVWMELSQEALVDRGGPSHQTVRNIERGRATTYRPVTFLKLDRALAWRDGTVEKILAGTATEEQLAEVVERDPQVHLKSGGAPVTVAGRGGLTVGGPEDHARADDRVVRIGDDLTRRVAQLVGILGSTPLRTDAEEAALRALSALLTERLDPLPPDPEDEARKPDLT